MKIIVNLVTIALFIFSCIVVMSVVTFATQTGIYKVYGFAVLPLVTIVGNLVTLYFINKKEVE